VTIDVYDGGGKRIATGRNRGARTVRVVPPGAVPNGLYILRVSSGTIATYGKVVVSR
jgi:hypothetical protein